MSSLEQNAKNKWIKKNLEINLDLFLAISAIFLGIFVIYISFAADMGQELVGFTILISSFIYITLRNKFKKIRLDPINHSRKFKLSLNIIFFTIYAVSIWLLYTELYSRHISYFILIFILIITLSIEIVFLNKLDTIWIILLKIILLSINIRAGLYYEYPSLMGYDAYYHARIAMLITEFGKIPPLELAEKYANYPIMHLLISINQIIMQMDIKNSIFLSIALPIIICSIFIYCIGKSLLDARIGLLAVLLINITNLHIVRGAANITPDSLALCYFLILLFLLFKERNMASSLIILFITSIIILTHQLSSFVILFIIILLYLSKFFIRFIYNFKNFYPPMNIEYFYILLFLCALQAYWMNTDVRPGLTFFEWVLRPAIAMLETGGEYNPQVLLTGPEYVRPMFETVLIQLCYLLIPFLTIGGVFLSILKKQKELALSFVIPILFILIYGIPLLGIRNLLTSRWEPFLSIIATLIISQYIIYLIFLSNKRISKVAITCIISFVIAFLMLITPAINKDTMIISNINNTVSSQFTNGEIYAARRIADVSIYPILLDNLYISSFLFYNTTNKKLNFTSFDKDLILNNDHNIYDTLIILRNSMKYNPICVKNSSLYGDAINMYVPQEFFNKFDNNNYNMIYYNGNVSAYLLNR
ncbi:MAG: hypothetical protein MUO26_11845 [Methanotrichaceae archaeon]|nr:hypothetical protein [Methanotrichaceae archaeon]